MSRAFSQTVRSEQFTYYGFHEPDMHDEIIMDRLMKNYAPKSKERTITLREMAYGDVDFIEDKIVELANTLPRGVDYRNCALVETIRTSVTRKRVRPNGSINLRGIPERFTFVVGR